MAEQPVAIITGAASGMGLGLTKHLHSTGWRVVMADLNTAGGERIAKELGDSVIFQQTNVADWDSNGALFKRAWEWAGRIDFFVANAGIGEIDSVFKEFPLDQDPEKPDLGTIEVDYIAVLYGLRWFVHYARKNKKPGGKMAITASCAGLYGFKPAPQYCAAKHALIGLVRASAPRFKPEGITINAVCPALVNTSIIPEPLKQSAPNEHWTPLSTINKAFQAFLDDDDMTGQTVECSLDKLFFRQPPEAANASQDWVVNDPEGFWKGNLVKKLDPSFRLEQSNREERLQQV